MGFRGVHKHFWKTADTKRFFEKKSYKRHPCKPKRQIQTGNETSAFRSKVGMEQ